MESGALQAGGVKQRRRRSVTRGVIPVVAGRTHVACDRRPWWRLDHLIAGTAPAVAGRAPAPILEGLSKKTESGSTASWFVGQVPAGKRILDITLILLALPVLLPLFAFFAVFIKIASPGPVFFTQERIGFREKRFRMFKFRSMKAGAATSSHANHTTILFTSDKPMEKMDHVDPRLIPFAWILRSTGLDELPQLINVLRGEMSLVGPRPCTTYEHEVMLPWHKRRFEVLPGLTGLWQVNGKNRTTFQQMINFDIAYSRSWSVWTDMKIMLSTFPVLLGQLREMIEKRRKPSTAAASA